MKRRISLSRLYPLLRLLFGTVLVLVGLVITPLPIPLGLLLILVGLTLITYDSSFLKKRLRRLRKKHPGFSDRLKKFESRTFFIVRDVVRSTDPARAEEKD